MNSARTKNIIAGTLVWTLAASTAYAQDADPAKKLSNPIANLISVPFQFNYNERLGPLGNGKQSYVNVQPVIPISLNADWNVISRTVLPIISQNDVAPGAGHQFGLGDTLQSLFFLHAAGARRRRPRRLGVGREEGLRLSLHAGNPIRRATQ